MRSELKRVLPVPALCRLLALPFSRWKGNHEITTYTARCLHRRVIITPVRLRQRAIGRQFMFIDFKSKWFQAYCRALLESDREQAQVYIEEALARIDERSRASELQRDELDAMGVATRYLNLMGNPESRDSASRDLGKAS